ncbi:MAG: hypothetical protein V2A78_05720 [bacterium]
MTIRDKLNSQLRWADGILLLSIFLVALSGFLSELFRPFFYYVIALPAASVSFIVAFIYLINGIRCPKCKSSVGNAAFSIGGWFRGTGKMKFCPFCGVDIDTEIE